MADIMAGSVFKPTALSAANAVGNNSLIGSLKQNKDLVNQAFENSIGYLSEMSGLQSSTVSTAVDGLMDAVSMGLENQLGFNPKEVITFTSSLIDLSASRNTEELCNSLFDMAADQMGIPGETKDLLTAALSSTFNYANTLYKGST